MNAGGDTRVQGIFCGVICSGICLNEGFRRIALRMGRVENVLTACHAEADYNISIIHRCKTRKATSTKETSGAAWIKYIGILQAGESWPLLTDDII